MPSGLAACCREGSGHGCCRGDGFVRLGGVTACSSSRRTKPATATKAGLGAGFGGLGVLFTICVACTFDDSDVFSLRC